LFHSTEPLQSIIIGFACPEPFDALPTPFDRGLRRINSAWETQDLDVLYWNPVIEGPDSKAELVWATIECTYVLPDVRVPSIPFWSKKMNSKIWKSLTVYVS